MKTKQVQIPAPPSELCEWEPEVLLAQVAAKRRLTVDELKERIRSVAEDSRRYETHLPFEHARDFDLTEEEFAHVEKCNFCLRLLQTIHPQESLVEQFQDFVERRMSGRVPFSVKRQVWSIAAAILLVMVLGTATWYWRNSSNRFSNPDLLITAAEYQLQGKTEVTNAFLIEGLASADLDYETLHSVKQTLDAASAAHRPIEGYRAIATYLEKVEPDARATRAYREHFVKIIARSDAKPEATRQRQE